MYNQADCGKACPLMANRLIDRPMNPVFSYPINIRAVIISNSSVLWSEFLKSTSMGIPSVLLETYELSNSFFDRNLRIIKKA